jgi:pyridinium-3,5-bisthiocarboxylic acid mononucleotide nickel chelatase
LNALLFDPFAGISGDMMLGALLDLGLPESWLREFVASLGLGDVGVSIERVQRRGIAATHVRFDLPEQHAHRHLRHVLEIIDRAEAPPAAKARAADAFRRIAVAEAAVHGTTVENVHFHEVGALDAILDVLCAMAGVEALGFDAFFTRPVALGSGWIDIQHGRYPVPAPATLRILEGVATTGLELAGECTTPTGAAILTALTGGQSAPDTITLRRTGFGAGSRDPQDRPNVLRLVACEAAAQPPTDSLVLIQADVDDLPPEYAATAQQALLDAGALDAVLTSVSMKKGRPGIRVEALARPDHFDAVLDTLFAATTTIGARWWPVARHALQRSEDTFEWRGQRIRRKRVRLPDGTERSKPEYEDVLRAAEALQLPAWQVRQALERAADDGREAAAPSADPTHDGGV